MLPSCTHLHPGRTSPQKVGQQSAVHLWLTSVNSCGLVSPIVWCQTEIQTDSSGSVQELFSPPTCLGHLNWSEFSLSAVEMNLFRFSSAAVLPTCSSQSFCSPASLLVTVTVNLVCLFSLNICFLHSHRSDQQPSPSENEEEVQRGQVSQPPLATGDIFSSFLVFNATAVTWPNLIQVF